MRHAVYILRNMKLGLMLSAYMKESGLSLRDVAKEIGCNHCTVRHLIQGKAVRLELLYKFNQWLIKPQKDRL